MHSNFFMVLLPVFLLSVVPVQGEPMMTNEFQTIDQATQNKSAGLKTSNGMQMNQWFDRIEIGGYANAGFVFTGADGAEPDGHFYAGERLFGANLLFDADILNPVSFHNELAFYNQSISLIEMYIEFKNIILNKEFLSIKIGRVDIPFGDEYMWQSSVDNPMILRTVAWPWGFSQGVLFFGKSGKLSYVASAMDGLGNDHRDTDDGAFKTLNAKIGLDPWDWIHISASGMKSGKHAQSAAMFNDISIIPVGANSETSTAGASPNTEVDFMALQGDLRLKTGNWCQLQGDYGTVHIGDISPFSRDILYYFIEAKFNLTSWLYLAGRYSTIGTFDSQNGYQFGGDYDNTPDFGFDVKSLTRKSIAIGSKLMDQFLFKVELDQDTVQLIDPAVTAGINPGNDRYTIATEIAVKF